MTGQPITDPGSFHEYVRQVVTNFTEELVTISPPGSIDSETIGQMLECHMMGCARAFASASADSAGHG